MRDTDDDPILAFYAGTGTDGAGRRIDEVWGFDQTALEYHHDFIQWLFPLAVASRFNPAAPLVTAAVVSGFAESADLQARLRRSLDLMLAFYGFRRDGLEIGRGGGFAARSAAWARPGNHNHLRLSRIIQSLDLLGLPEEARALQRAVLRVARDLGPSAVSPRTVEVWQSLLPVHHGFSDAR